jgi:hypothetical protein
MTTWTAYAAESGMQSETLTGVTNIGLGVFLISVAGALVLTLLIRASATPLVRIIGARLGKRRIRIALVEKCKDVLDDFILPGAYGGLTKIDHAVLTSGGILCIQTKHYNGTIFGSADGPQWTLVDGLRKCRFLNPLIQNEGRSKALRNLVPDVPVANLVVFTGSVRFSSPQEKNVIHVSELKNYIAKFVFGPCKVSDWDAVWLTVKAAALTDDETRKDFHAQLTVS